MNIKEQLQQNRERRSNKDQAGSNQPTSVLLNALADEILHKQIIENSLTLNEFQDVLKLLDSKYGNIPIQS